MLSFLAAVLRVIAGFVLASLAAGFVQVLFAVTPTELVYADDARLGLAANWGLLTATQIAVFSAPFALISIVVSEWMSIRSFAYHALVAMAIAVAGFGLIHVNESPTEASIVNSYAMAAYLTSGFVGGFVYWLFAGRLAGRSPPSTIRMETDRRSSEAKGGGGRMSRSVASESGAGKAATGRPADGAKPPVDGEPSDKKPGAPSGVPGTGSRSSA